MNARIIGPLAAPGPGWDHVRILSGSIDVGNRVSVTERIARRGHEPPLHRHRHEDLLIYIVDGHLRFQIDGRHFPAGPGSCVLLPRGTEHGYAIDSEVARLLVILTPGGAEGYLTELHEAAMASTDADSSEAIERLVASAARYGIDITGPPPGRA